MSLRARCAVFASVAIVLLTSSAPASADDGTLITNGDFETGALVGFTSDGINGGLAKIVEEGTCFSFFDTRGITMSGEFTAVVRSGDNAHVDSVGILTSAPFAAGPFISFEALSESVFGIADPVDFEVRVLTAQDTVLSAQTLATNIIYLSNPCGFGPTDAPFSQHMIDTSAFIGQSVKIQFRQHTNYELNGFFTLVDNVKTYGMVSDPSCTTTADTSLTECGFETPVLGDGNFSYGTPGSAWSFSGSAGIASNNSAFTGPQLAPQGLQVAFIQASGSRVEQAISDFVSDRQYALTFSAAQRGDNSQDFAVLLDRALLAVFRPLSSNYAEFTVSFATTAGTHTLQFLGLNTAGGDNTAFIDSMRLVSGPLPPGTPQPEPKKETIFSASCPSLRPDVFSVSAVFFASDAAPNPGTTSAFHVTDTKQVIIVFTTGTTRLATEQGSFCYFLYQAGPVPPAPFDVLFSAWAFVVPHAQ